MLIETLPAALTAPPPRRAWRSPLHIGLAILGACALLAGLALVVLLYAAHQPVYAAAALLLLAGAVVIYLSPRLYAWRYVVPGALAALLFIVLPMAYTFAISFTNYSSDHLLSLQRSTEVLLGRTIDSGDALPFRLYADGARHRLEFKDDAGAAWRSAPFALGGALRLPLTAVAAEAPPTAGAPLPVKALIARQAELRQLTAVLPDGTQLRYNSLRSFTANRAAYTRNADGTLRSNADGGTLKANLDTGYWTQADGKTVQPGFRSTVGWQNYVRIFREQRFLDPFMRVFSWTVTFAALNTVFSFGIGVLLAVALNWDALRGRAVYRIMLFLPYAVPAFISIPVFRGLFNENLGEINMVLDLLFGIRPGWFSEATLARSMVLIVNAWLSYPYMMILCMGLIKAIPADLYEASAVAGAGPLANFFRITLPLIARPIAPLLVASFAVNFNNLTLIALLTGGAPDYLETQVPVGATDLLASYTYRIAFQDSGQNYALACAISSIVFLIVAAIAIFNLRLFKIGREAR